MLAQAKRRTECVRGKGGREEENREGRRKRMERGRKGRCGGSEEEGERR